MKKNLFVAATAMFFFISCNDSSSGATSTETGTGTAKTDSSQSEKNLVNNRKVYTAIETGDSSVINELIASDAVDHQSDNGMDIKGNDSVKHMLNDMHNHVKDFKIDLITSAANDDYIFSLVHFGGTMTDAFMGMAAGQKMDDKSVDVVKIKDGKMVEHWGFVDANEMMKHMKEMPMGKMNENGKMDSEKKKK